MPVDYSQIPTNDLKALKEGRLSAVSTKTLMMVKGKSGASAEPQMLASHKPAGQTPTATQGAASWKKTASKIYTPVLEGLGMAGGGVVGSATASPGVGTVLGAGLGFAGGKQAASLADTMLGIGHEQPLPKNLLQATGRVAGDVMQGATMEMGGQVAGKALGAGMNKFSQWKREGTPLSTKSARSRAGNFLLDRTTPAGPADAAARQRNKLQTTQLRSRTGIDRPSLAQESGGLNTAATEQAYNAQPEMMQASGNRDAVITRQAKDNVLGTIQGERGGETIKNKVQSYAAGLESNAKVAERSATSQATKYAAPTDAQPLGESIVREIQKARAPFSDATKKAYAAVPDYPITAGNFDKTIKTLRTTPMTKEQEQVVQDLIQYADSAPKTTQGLQKVDQTFSAYLRDPSKRLSTPYIKELQTALRSDFDAFGAAAEKGDVALSNGELVVPSELKKELARVEEQIGKSGVTNNASGESAASQEAINAGKSLDRQGTKTYIVDTRSGKSRPAVGMRPEDNPVNPYDAVVRVTPDGRQQVLTKGAQAREVPRLPDPAAPSVATTPPKSLIARRTELMDQIKNLKPAEDVAKKYTTARQAAKTEFDRFTRGSLEDVQQLGNEASGMKMPAENVSRKFTTPSGADDLITAIGQPKAAEQMREHFAAEANRTGMRPEVLAKWVGKNKAVLQKYGLYDEFSSLSKTQATVREAQAAVDRFNKSAVAKVLGAEPETAIQYALGQKNPERVMRELKAFGRGDKQYLDGLKVALRDHILKAVENTPRDALGANKVSLAKADRLIGQQYDRAMKVIYSPKEIQTLKDYAQVVEMLSRNKNVSASGGSTTVEKLMGGATKATPVSQLQDVATHAAGGWISSLKNLIVGVVKGVKDSQVKLIDQYVKEALIDPAKADALIKLAKGNRSQAVLRDIDSGLKGYAKAQAMRAAVVGAAGDKGGGEEIPLPTEETPLSQEEPEAREAGGPVVPGQQYKVGEKQPETLLNADGTQQIVGAAGQQTITAQQPGMVVPTVDPDTVLQQVLSENKGLSGVHNRDNTKVIFADPERTKQAQKLMGKVGLEYWPDSEGGTKDWPHPAKGKNVLEVYDEELKNDPKKLKEAVYGDLMHGMSKDGTYKKLRDEFMKNFTPEETARIAKKRTWWEDVNSDKGGVGGATYDAYVRGWLGADAKSAREGQEKSGNTMYSKKQLEILKKMERYIKTGKEDTSAVSE